MQEHEVRELFERLRSAMDPDLEYEHRHEDFLVEMPQTGERMTRDQLRTMQRSFPGGPPRIRLERLVGAGDRWVGQSVVEYADGSTFYGVSFVEFRDGKMWRETRFYAEPFEVPAWRAQLFQQAGQPVAG
jgi:SnoaL-like domain